MSILLTSRLALGLSLFVGVAGLLAGSGCSSGQGAVDAMEPSDGGRGNNAGSGGSAGADVAGESNGGSPAAPVDDRAACAPHFIVENLPPLVPVEEWDAICSQSNLPDRVVAQPTTDELPPVDAAFADGRLVALGGEACTLCMAGETLTSYDRGAPYNCDQYYACGGCDVHVAVNTLGDEAQWLLFMTCEKFGQGTWVAGPANAPGYCKASCGSNSCGRDGCGGTCPECPAGFMCGSGGYCVDSGGCVPGSGPCCNSCFTDCGGSSPGTSLETFQACLGACVACCQDCGY